MENLRQDATREKDHLKLLLEREGQEAGEEKARLRSETEALQKELEATRKAFDREKVGAEAMRSVGQRILLASMPY